MTGREQTSSEYKLEQIKVVPREYKLEQVPKWAREVNNEAYTPRFISIGPYHRGENDNPMRCKKLKTDSVNWLLSEPEFKGIRLQPVQKQAIMENLKGHVKNTRRFYAQEFHEKIDDEEWACMLLEDGCFIIKYLIDITKAAAEDHNINMWVYMQLRIDLILLENQLPFFILEKIFSLLIGEMYDAPRILRIMVIYWVFKSGKEPPNDDVYHLVHLIHLVHCNLFRREKKILATRRNSIFSSLIYQPNPWKIFKYAVYYFMLFLMMMFARCCSETLRVEEDENIASAMELHKLFITFKRKPVQRGFSRYSINMSDGDSMLEIPQLVVSCSQAPLLHNLIAWEHRPERNQDKEFGDYFTKYAFLMYNLINSHEDIALLQKQGILLNNYGTDDQVITYFKNLCLWNLREPAETEKHPSCWQKIKSRLCEQKGSDVSINHIFKVLQARSKDPAYRYLSDVKKCIDSPLKFVIVVTSTLVFLSTMLQTVYTVRK